MLYTLDAAIGGTPPRWGTVGGTSDGCPNPPGATGDGCVVGARLSRLQASGNVMTGTEQVFLTPEANETFLVNLSSPVNATISDGSGRGRIRDDD